MPSTYSNGSHVQPFSTFAFVPLELHCFIYKPGCFIFSAFAVANVALLLPLCVLVLRHGLQQRRKQGFSSTTHADTFTYHLVLMELIHILGCILCFIGIYMGVFPLLVVWPYFFSISLYGEGIIHMLTCVEHYLAVVHPITFLSLRTERWTRIRSVTIVCIWLLSCALTSLILIEHIYLPLFLCLSIVSLITISFCCLSVLCVLTHPGPGERGGAGDRVRLHQSKQRAFYIIVATLGVLMLRCVYVLVWAVQSVLSGPLTNCVLTLGTVWVCFPGSLVSPLVHLHKTGMLGCCNNRK